MRHRRVQAGARTRHLRTTTDAAELLADPDIDVVSVASWDDAHFEQVRMALEHGKHVFAEKPLVLYADQAREIAAMLAERPELRAVHERAAAPEPALHRAARADPRAASWAGCTCSRATTTTAAATS